MTRLYRVNPPSRRNSLSLVTDTYDRQDTDSDGVTDSATNVRATTSLDAWAAKAQDYVPKLWETSQRGNDEFVPYYQSEIVRTGLSRPPVPSKWRDAHWLKTTPRSNMSKDERLLFRALEAAIGKRPTGKTISFTRTDTYVTPKLATTIATSSVGVMPKVALAAAALVLVALVAKKLRKKRKKKAAA